MAAGGRPARPDQGSDRRQVSNEPATWIPQTARMVGISYADLLVPGVTAFSDIVEEEFLPVIRTLAPSLRSSSATPT